MNSHYQTAVLEKQREAPLFASPWMALFLLLRRELSTPKDQK